MKNETKNIRISERIEEFCKKQNINKAGFCKKAGLARSTATNANQSLNSDTRYKIKTAFPELNIEWLLTGEGAMLMGSCHTVNGNGNQLITDNESCTIHADNRQYHSDSPDVLRHEIELLETRIADKESHIKSIDEQLSKKDEQLSKKDEHIDRLLRTIEELTGSISKTEQK